MKDSTEEMSAGLHVGMIMDGNGRWAVARGRPRFAGHREGAKVVRKIVEAAPDLGIGILTLYAFSSDNWRRPSREVTALMRLFRSYLAAETARCVQNGVRMKVIGRRDRIPPVLVRAIEAAESATCGGSTLLMRIAIDYSARDSLVAAASRLCPGATRDDMADAIAEVTLSPVTPDVDLLVRTGGEQRLSDFMLWECAYAELFFESALWPEYTPHHLETAVRWFTGRERRFGGVLHAAAAG